VIGLYEGQLVKPRHGHHVARLKLVEQPAKLGAVGLGPAHHFAEHLLASGLGQLAHLCVNALAVRRYPRIPEFHAATMQRSCAAKKTNLFLRPNFAAKLLLCAHEIGLPANEPNVRE
jgi:hypothetical protein